MVIFLAKRLGYYAILLFLVTSLTWFLCQSTFAPAERFLHINPPISPNAITAMLNDHNANPNVPIFNRYWVWLHGIVTEWNWGTIIQGSKSSLDEMMLRVGISLRLVIIGSVFGVMLGLWLGAVTASFRRSMFDKTVTIVSFIIIATPTAVIILLVQNLFFVGGQATGYSLPATNPVDPTLSGMDSFVFQVQALIMPTICIVLGSAAGYSRYMYITTLDTMESDFVRTARAKGLSKKQALRKHAYRMALIPMTQYLAFAVGGVLTGSLFIELYFNWQGVSKWFLAQVGFGDAASVTLFVAFSAAITLLSALLADFMQALLDPRVRNAR